MIKKYLILIISIIISLYIGVLSGKQIQANQDQVKISDSTEMKQAITPTPTDSVAMEQQCSNDAYRLLDHMSQEYNLDTFSLSDDNYHQTAFSQKLNTCVAEIKQYGNLNGKTINISTVYDTVSGTVLAQYDGNNADVTFNFTSDKLCAGIKNCKVTFNDYDNYKNSIGL